MAMTDAARAEGADPDRASFTHALQAARTQVTLAEGVTATGPGAIDAAVRTNLLPTRRPRISARKVNSPISRYHSWTGQARPTSATTADHIEITVHERTTNNGEPTSPPATEPTSDDAPHDTPATGAADEDTADPGGRHQLALTVMNSTPGTP